MDEFFDEFRRLVKPTGRRSNWSPFQFVDAWRTFVQEVRDGYEGDIYEYWNDLFIRKHLETALNSQSLDSWEAWRSLREQIHIADEEFREILSAGPLVRPDDSWWGARLPPRAGDEFVEEAENIFGVQLESTE